MKDQSSVSPDKEIKTMKTDHQVCVNCGKPVYQSEREGAGWYHMNGSAVCSGLIAAPKTDQVNENQNSAIPSDETGNIKSYPCGCQVRRDASGGHFIHACNLHNAAPELYEACKAMIATLNGPPMDFMAMLNAHRGLDAAVALVDGKTNDQFTEN